jgi:hypothetical protein
MPVKILRLRISLFVFFTLAAPIAAFAETKILLIGDSHSTGTFKDGVLGVLDEQKDLRTAVYASCGSRPRDWFSGSKFQTSCGFYRRPFAGKAVFTKSEPTPDFEVLVKENRPDTVVIAMGTNQYGDDVAAAKASVIRMIRAAKAQGANCIWVGPPKVASSKFSEAMKSEFQAMLVKITREEQCSLIDSRRYTDARDTETQMHIHYPGGAGRKWGSAVGGDILTLIRQNGPTGGANSSVSSGLPSGSNSGN